MRWRLSTTFSLGFLLVFGAATASRKILYIQAMPAALGLALLWIP